MKFKHFCCGIIKLILISYAYAEYDLISLFKICSHRSLSFRFLIYGISSSYTRDLFEDDALSTCMADIPACDFSPSLPLSLSLSLSELISSYISFNVSTQTCIHSRVRPVRDASK